MSPHSVSSFDAIISCRTLSSSANWLSVAAQADNMELVEALIDGSFEINVTRKAGGSDVKVPINIGRDKPETSQAFASCTLKLVDVMKKKFGD